MKNLIKVSSFIYILVVFISCHKDSTPPQIFTDKGNIGSQGGTVKTNDGASVEIPIGALSTNQTITISNVTASLQKINIGSKMYELGPDSLKFSDSITIKLPFDDTYLKQNQDEKNYGIRVTVYSKGFWSVIPAKIDLVNKVAQVKTTHFSTYAVSYPSQFAEFFNHYVVSGTFPKLPVPYYYQGHSGWCYLYSASMLAKYAGYNYKAHNFALLLNKDITGGFRPPEIYQFDQILNQIGMQTESIRPPWVNVNNLCGYLMTKLEMGSPVLLSSWILNHAFIVAGYNSTGFFINDPSGDFLNSTGHNITSDGVTPSENCACVLVPFDKFKSALTNHWDVSLFPDYTYVITSKGSEKCYGPSVNFVEGTFLILNSAEEYVAKLQLDGTYKPNGYAIVDRISNNIIPSLDGSSYFDLSPVFSNIDPINNLSAIVKFKFDNQEIMNVIPSSVNISAGNSRWREFKKRIQLNNLGIGKHTFKIEFYSANLSELYDSWSFDFDIKNPLIFSLPSVTTSNLLNITQTSATVGGIITADGGASITERGVYWGTSPNPETTGTKLPISSVTGVFSTNLLGLNPNTLYYVKAYAINSQGTAYGSQVSFTTLPAPNNPPVIPSTPNPTNGATSVSTSPTLTWTCSDPESDPMTFDIYFGSTSNPTTLAGPNLTTMSYSPSMLSSGSTYYWKVVAKDNHNNSTPGPVWSFTTVQGGQTGTVTDIDGNTYKTITIGSQVWMAENLRTSRYSNGVVIPTDLTNTDWNNTTLGAYSIYNNDNTNNSNYGKLYNFYSVVDSRNLCPTSWHVPSKSEFEQMINYFGGDQVAYSSILQGGSSGINLKFGGNRDYPGNYAGIGSEAIYWSSSVPRWYLLLYNQAISWYTPISPESSNRGYSIRCVQGGVSGGIIPTDGLAAYYPFNGNANDASGNGNNGIINGATPTTDRKGNSNSAYSFNGTSNYITVQNSTSLQLTTVASFNIWVLIPSGIVYDTRPAVGPHFFCKGATWGDKWANYSLQLTGQNGVIAFELNTTSGGQYNGVSTTNPIGRDNWHMITSVYQAGQIKFYIDGILTDTKTNTITSLGVSSLPLYLGVRYPSSVYTGGHIGKLDDFRIYNRALTDQEITALYNE